MPHKASRASSGAVVDGVAHTGRVITSAALIMVSVFFAFIINGDPTARAADIRNVVTVFRQGVGYDSERLIASVKGMVGVR